MAIKIVKDVDLIYEVKKYDLILIGTSILNTLGNGFQYKVGLNFPEVFEMSKIGSKYGDLNKLGHVDYIESEPKFGLCYITRGRFNPRIRPDAVEYDALAKCLENVKKNYSGISIATTIMGTSIYEGGGDRGKVMAIFNNILSDEDITLYDYSQTDVNEDKKLMWKKVVESVGSTEYEENKKRYFWETSVGIYTPMPEGKTLKEIKEIANSIKETKKGLVSFK